MGRRLRGAGESRKSVQEEGEGGLEFEEWKMGRGRHISGLSTSLGPRGY